MTTPAPPKTPSTGISDLVLSDIDAALKANTTATTAAPAPADAPRPKPSPYDDLDGVDLATAMHLTGGIGKERWQAKTPEERTAWLEQVEELDRRFSENGIPARRPAGGAAFGLGDVHSSTGAVATVPVPPPLPPAVQAVRDAVAAERHQPIQAPQPVERPAEQPQEQPQPAQHPADQTADQTTKRHWWSRRPKEELPDGVLPPAGPLTGGLIGLVGTAAAGEAFYNIFKGAHELLGLPLYMSLAAPLLFEAAASSFAIQDLQDRRRGVHDKAMTWSANVLIGLSSAVGAVVGFFLYGPFGPLLGGGASLLFGWMVHRHGERAIAAHKTRVKESDTWKAAEQRRAETDSARDVLEMLLPGDRDGKATVELLKRRMDAGTLSPGDALLAAGWHRRSERGLTASQTIRVETVAATVWGQDGLPSPPPAPAAPRRSNRRTSGAAPSQGGATGVALGATAGGGSSQASQGGGETSRKRRLDDAALGAFIQDYLTLHPDDGERPVLKALSDANFSGSAKRVREALRVIKGDPSPLPAAGGTTSATGGGDAR
jgi:hypothetical protein